MFLFFFFCIMIEHVGVHLHTKNHFGDCIMWRGASYFVFNTRFMTDAGKS